MEKLELEEQFEKKKVFENLRHDFKNAQEAKSSINKLIVEWNDAYECVIPSMKNRSKYKAMEVAKQIAKIKANITEPFTNSTHPIRCSTTKYGNRIRIIQKYLNSEFTSNFDRVDFMDKYSDILCREGTVWAKSIWRYNESNKREVLKNASIEEITSREYDPDVIKQNEDGKTFYVEYNHIALKENRPDAIICRNEHIYPDPSARSIDELRFLCHEKEYTISELREMNRFSEETIDKLEKEINDKDDSSLGTARDSKNQDYGYKEGFNTLDSSRKKISVIEYYGYYDLNGDGIAEPIFASWSKNGKINLILEESSMPHNPIPFYNAVFSAVPFSLWGNPLAYFIDDNQRAKTGIVRGIMDNLSLANNGQKFIKNGSIDYLNFKRMTQGEKYIQVNGSPEEIIKDGSFNHLPSSLFNVYEMISRDAEEISGNNGNGIGMKGKSSDDDTQNLTLSQQMQLGLVLKTSSLLSNIMKDWVKMAESFLENEQIESLFTENDMLDLFVFSFNDNINITFKVATNAQRQVRLQQINLLLQQSKALGEMMPQEQMRGLVAEMFELFDMFEEADKVRTYIPQPSEEQMVLQQIGLENAMLENSKLQHEIEEIKSRTTLNGSSARKSILDGMSGFEYKKAQSAEKMAKAQTHQTTNALMPAETLASIQSMLTKIKL